MQHKDVKVPRVCEHTLQSQTQCTLLIHAEMEYANNNLRNTEYAIG